MIIYPSKTMLLDCPYCRGKCQFTIIEESMSKISSNKKHVAYNCVNCNGLIATIWVAVPGTKLFYLTNWHPGVGKWASRIELSYITNDKVREDFQHAMECYNGRLYDACMIMARRTIQQEMLARNIKGDNLYEQIENTGISQNLKKLLHKVKNFGNNGAHPDFCLYDNDGKEIGDEEKERIAELSLDFLEIYFIDQYEISPLVGEAPKTERELKAES